MSYHWENVVWQSKDGKWGIGFYKREATGSVWDDEYDSEWDDRFDYSQFMFASTGHLTAEGAYRSWPGANPGSHTIYSYNTRNAKEIAEFEDLARAYKDPSYAQERQDRLEREQRNKHRKALRDRLRQNPPKANILHYVSIDMGKNRCADSYQGILRVEGDWLGITIPKKPTRRNTVTHSFVKVWNVKTQNIGPKIVDVYPTPYRRY